MQPREGVGMVERQVVDELALELAELAAGDHAHLDDAEKLHEEVGHPRVDRRLRRCQRVIEVERDEADGILISHERPACQAVRPRRYGDLRRHARG